jgi:anaphase-promoting complex subunit 11
MNIEQGAVVAAASTESSSLPPSRKRRSSETSLSTLTNRSLDAAAASTSNMSLHASAATKSAHATMKNNGNHPVSIKVRLKRFHAVAAWSWNANDHVCGICQSPFEGVCPGVKYPGEDCPVVWGKCGHAFHLQCVSKWLGQAASKNSCPICRQEWEFGQNPVNTAATSSTGSTAAAPPPSAPTVSAPVP